MDEQNSSIVGTSMIWIFFIVSTLLTAFTFLVYYCLLHRNGPVIKRLMTSIRTMSRPNITTLKQRLRRAKDTDAELQDFGA